VATNIEDPHDTVGSWAKRLYYANRAAIETVLRPYDLGSTQWSVLYQLAHHGPTTQRDLGQLLHLERATLSGVVANLVRKGLVDQVADTTDQRQRVLQLTLAGKALWKKLPDPFALIRDITSKGVDASETATAIRVLREAIQRLDDSMVSGALEPKSGGPAAPRA
jgi:DNA-binding MarR family transcriptional regulator